MPTPNTYTSISGKIIKETDAAMLFRFRGESHWFPLSQICEIHRDIAGPEEAANDCDQIKVADWLLVKRGISL